MTNDDKQFLKEFLRGAGSIGIIVGIIILGLAFLLRNGTELKPSAEVVDTYKGCDLVQWHYSMLADYKYFLHCASSQGGTPNPQMP